MSHVLFGIYLWIPGGSDGKEYSCNSGDLGSIRGSGRSPGVGNGNPLQDSCPRTGEPGGYSPWGTRRESGKMRVVQRFNPSRAPQEGLGLSPLCPRQPPESVNRWLCPPDFPPPASPPPRLVSRLPGRTGVRWRDRVLPGVCAAGRPTCSTPRGAATQLRPRPLRPRVLAATPARRRRRCGAQTVGTARGFAPACGAADA